MKPVQNAQVTLCHIFYIYCNSTVLPLKSDSGVILGIQFAKLNTNVYTSLELVRIDRSLVY